MRVDAGGPTLRRRVLGRERLRVCMRPRPPGSAARQQASWVHGRECESQQLAPWAAHYKPDRRLHGNGCACLTRTSWNNPWSGTHPRMAGPCWRSPFISLHDIRRRMRLSRVHPRDYRALAEFRYQMRRFARFSDQAARAAGIEPQQHQLLLAIKGMPEGVAPTMGALAERLQILHHSAVELVDRMEERGLLRRERAADDRRQVLLALTARGEALLARLSAVHRAEVRSIGPRLLRALYSVVDDVAHFHHAAASR